MADMIGPFLAVLGSALVVTARAITDQRDGKIFLHVMLSMRSGRAASCRRTAGRRRHGAGKRAIGVLNPNPSSLLCALIIYMLCDCCRSEVHQAPKIDRKRAPPSQTLV